MSIYIDYNCAGFTGPIVTTMGDDMAIPYGYIVGDSEPNYPSPAIINSVDIYHDCVIIQRYPICTEGSVSVFNGQNGEYTIAAWE